MEKRHITYFVNDIAPVNFCGKTVMYQMNFDGELNGAFELPFDIEPTTGEHDFNKCETCKKNLKILTEELTQRYKGTPKQPGFPHCCKAHSNLMKMKGFRRELFDNVPQMVARKIIYTSQHIENNHKQDNWYKIITDYVNWVIESLGKMPNGCGEGLFGSDYLIHIRDMVKRTKILPADKKKRILDFLASFEVMPKENLPDFQMLIQTYEKWFKIFPFELNSYFGKLKEHYKKTLPIFQTTPETNIYSGYATAKQHTIVSIIDTLIGLTKNLLYQINAATLLEKGLLTDTTKIKYELVVHSRKLELNDLYKIDFPNEERGYVDILKRWFNDEKNFIDEITPLLKHDSLDQEENSKKDYEYTHREIMIAHSFKVDAKTAEHKTANQWKQERGNACYNDFYTLQPRTTNKQNPYKAPTKKELQNVVEMLKEDPSAQRLAINKLEQLQNL